MIELYTPPHRRVHGSGGAPGGAEVMEELDLMRAWLRLDRVEIGSHGELAAAMRA